jgi:phosphoribosylformylglycinamidine synthase subunit PurS
MKAKVYVTLKPGVLDPQGKAIHHSVELLGFENVEDIRQGKYFEVSLGADVSESDAHELAGNIAKNILANPVIEDYKIEIVQ